MTRSDHPASAPNLTQSWHALAEEQVLQRLEAGSAGLTSSEAAKRLLSYGANTLPDAPEPLLWQRLVKQFQNLFIYVLLASAALAILLGEYVDAGVIIGVVFLNAIIGVIQEGRAEKALAALRTMVSPTATVLRDRQRLSVAAVDLVPGDIVLLDAGDQVPADLRLIKARTLTIDEAVLTGESVPVSKTPDAVPENSPLAERASLAFAGTLVSTGYGVGIVVATGLHSELGRIGELIGRVANVETPLIRQMNSFARQLTLAIMAISGFAFLFAVLVRGYPLSEGFMAMVAMAVAAIPEGLPAVMTITLAIGVERMARRNAIIRRLPAVETLGSVSTICSDKTGTLTRNEMTVTDVVLRDRTLRVSGTGYSTIGTISEADGSTLTAEVRTLLDRLARTALLSSDATLNESDGRISGDPMEAALVAFAGKAGFVRTTSEQQSPRIDHIPFDAAYRFMATLHTASDSSATTICLKGAPEAVLDRCNMAFDVTGPSDINPDYWKAAMHSLASRGRRVLAIATHDFTDGQRDISHDDVAGGLTLLGLIGLIDPPRPEAISAIAECRDAGITVKMITGDHAVTASTIASELGLEHFSNPVSGTSIDTLEPAALNDLVSRSDVFARTSPEHKLRLVCALQEDGAVVAMTGDGVNDAPALKRADVGVAMGMKGTDAAKGAADIVLADDNFASIVAAIREGRTVRDNLTKVIAWTLPTSFGAMLVIATAILFGLALPLSPVHVLWINMVTAVGLGLVLAFEPSEPTIMQRKPRSPQAPILSSFLIWRIAFVGVLFAIIAFAMFAWARARGLSIEEGRTIVVNTIVVLEIFYLFAVRYLGSTSITITGIFGTPAVLIGVATTTIAQLAFTYWAPLQALFQTRPVALMDGIAIVMTGIVLLVLLEVEKFVLRRMNLMTSL